MTKHTPGPWAADGSGAIFVDKKQGEPIQTCGEYAVRYGEGTEEALANAYLIAAAPDLLEACRAALEKCPFPVGAALAKEQLQKAIAKAEGIDD